MLDNNFYNLVEQLSQESKSLWRIENEYIADAEGNTEETAYWKELAEDKKKHINDLKELIKTHL